MSAAKSNQTFTTESEGVVKEWDVDRLWSMSKLLRIQRQPITKFIKVIREYMDSTQRDIDSANAEYRFEMHDFIDRCRNANMSYPIIISPGSDFVVMDGFHRLFKAYVSGDHYIQVVQFDKMPDPDRVNGERFLPGNSYNIA